MEPKPAREGGGFNLRLKDQSSREEYLRGRSVGENEKKRGKGPRVGGLREGCQGFPREKYGKGLLGENEQSIN